MESSLKARKVVSPEERRERERRASRDRRASRRNEILQRAIIDHLSEGILVADHGGLVTDANPAAARILGVDGKSLYGERIFGAGWNPVNQDGEPWPLEAHPASVTLRSGEGCSGVVMGVEQPKGSRIWISVSTCAVALPRPHRGHGVVATFVDVTAERTARAALAWSEQRFRDLTEVSADWYWEQDAHFRFVQVSEGIAAHVVPPSALIGRCRWEMPWINMSADDWAAHRAVLERGEPFHDLELQRRDDQGALQTISVSGRPAFDARGRLAGYRGTGRNITERRRAEERLAQLATHDGVTGLASGAMLRELLARAIERARREQTLLGVMFVDLDQFAAVNDAHGHAVGDDVLREVGRRLRGCLRGTDTVARPGGDEFAILLEGIRRTEEIPRLAQKLIDAVSTPMRAGERDVLLSASIGISLYPLDGDAPESLLRNADLAMYHAKQDGRNGFRFHEKESPERAELRTDLKARLHRAIERDEFVVHYQPQLDIASGRIIGVEALVRWNSEELGLVPPARFMPFAEETGLIVPIGEGVLRAACRQMRMWQAQGCAPASVAVNLSARQFRHEGLAQSIEAILHEAGLEPCALELELSESTVMRSSGNAGATLAELHAIGVGLTVDDFGTGFSSLASLERFPIGKLKVDQSFVRDIHASNGAAAIVDGAVALARRLGRKAVAEGVETAAQLDFLRATGCEEYQGYLFSRPLAQAQIGALLARNSPAGGAEA